MSISGHRMLNFNWKPCTRIHNFLFYCFMLVGMQFQVTIQQEQLLFSKSKGFEKLINGVSFILFMYKRCIYCLVKERLGVSKVSLCNYLVFGFSGAICHFLRVGPACFPYDCLSTLWQRRKPCLQIRDSSHSDVAWSIPSLIVKVIVDYDYMTFLVSLIDYDYPCLCKTINKESVTMRVCEVNVDISHRIILQMLLDDISPYQSLLLGSMKCKPVWQCEQVFDWICPHQELLLEQYSQFLIPANTYG